jgi:hypothetical protein
MVNLIQFRAESGASPIESHKVDPAIDAKGHRSSFGMIARQTSDWSLLLNGHPPLFVFVPLMQGVGGIHRVELGDTTNWHAWRFFKTHSPAVYA